MLLFLSQFCIFNAVSVVERVWKNKKQINENDSAESVLSELSLIFAECCQYRV